MAVSPLAGLAGGETALLRLLPRLRERGWSPALTVPGGGELGDRARSAGLPVRRLPLGPPARRTAASFAGAALAPVVLRGADVVFLNGLPAQRVLPLLRSPAVVRVNNPLERPPRAWSRKDFWRRVRAVVADSQHVAAECLAAGAPPELVEAVHPAAWNGPAPPERPGRPDGGRVAFVGQIEPRKGVADLIEAADRFLGDHPSATLTVVGGPPPGAEDYAQKVRDMAGASDRIRFQGYRPDAAASMVEFDLVVVPSQSEPFGTVAAEAAAAGAAVVASDVGGLREVVLHEETGLLVPPGRPRELAEAVSGLLAEPERMRALGERARERASRFSPDAYADRIAAVLERALSA